MEKWNAKKFKQQKIYYYGRIKSELKNHTFGGQWQSSSETHPSEQVPVSTYGRRS
jgi:hypothetical protein